MEPREYDKLSQVQKDHYVSLDQGILEPTLERQIIDEGDIYIIAGGITTGRFSTEGLRQIVQRFPGPENLAESASHRENSPLELMAEVPMHMFLEREVYSFCQRMGRPEKAEPIVDANFPSKDNTLTLRDVWGEPIVIPESEK